MIFTDLFRSLVFYYSHSRRIDADREKVTSSATQEADHATRSSPFQRKGGGCYYYFFYIYLYMKAIFIQSSRGAARRRFLLGSTDATAANWSRTRSSGHWIQPNTKKNDKKASGGRIKHVKLHLARPLELQYSDCVVLRCFFADRLAISMRIASATAHCETKGQSVE